MKLSIKLDARDNVTTVTEVVPAGQCVRVLTNHGAEIDQIQVKGEIPAFHKVALVDIADGHDVQKYGEVIGHASALIRRGEWVHVHNLESADLPEDLNAEEVG